MKSNVFKVGGSLLDLPDLGERLHFLLKLFDSDCNLIVAGGGRYVRELESKKDTLSCTQMHWDSIKIMTDNTLSLKTFFKGSTIADSVLVKKQGVFFLDTVKFCQNDFNLIGGPFLPERNDVRSDSIALRVALRFQFARLFLLKSCDRPNSNNWEKLSSLNYVDPYFYKLITTTPNKLDIQCINLRNLNRIQPFQTID